jgi:hypothetical protein
MHLQIVEANGQLTRRYVANGSHCWAMCIVPNRKAAVRAELTKRLECSVASYSGLGATTTLEYWIDARRYGPL